MTQHVIYFSHGKESGPWGSKIEQLAQVARIKGFHIESVDYRSTLDPDERVEILLSLQPAAEGKLVLVGSSMGGYVSLVAAPSNKPLGIFLLAPALFIPDYQHQTYPTNLKHLEIVHGWSDDVIPVEHSIKYAQQAQCSLHLIDGDHRLNSSIEQVVELFKTFLVNMK